MSGAGKSPVFGPGGGGGAGSPGSNGGAGYAGQVELVYTAGTAPSANILRFLLEVPSAGDTNNGLVMTMATSGTVATVKVTYTTASSGSLVMTMYDGTNTLLATSTAITGVNAGLFMASMELYTSGASVTYDFRLMNVSTGVVTTQSGTADATATLGAVTSYTAGGASLSASAVGHVVVQYAYESLPSVLAAILGHAGELAGNRFTRLCTELGIPFVLTGSASTTPAMGPQPDATVTTVLQQVEDLDRGLLFEPMTEFGLGYRTYASLVHQVPSLVADYSQAHLSPPVQPQYDDQLTRNDITITRSSGSSYTITQPTGPMSTQDPPNGVGDYTYSLTVNANTDAELAAVAAPILALGTVDEFRYPVLTFDLTRSEVQGLFGYLTDLVEGDYVQVLNLLTALTSNPVNQLALGFTVDISAFQFTIALNCIPESPFA